MNGTNRSLSKVAAKHIKAASNIYLDRNNPSSTADLKHRTVKNSSHTLYNMYNRPSNDTFTPVLK